MSIREVEFDPLTGIKNTITYRDDGKVDIVRSQDLEPMLKHAEILRKKADPIEHNTWNHYATIPVLGEIEMRKAGINPDRDDTSKVIAWINKNHPEWKTTNFWHNDRRAKLRDPRLIVK